MPRIFISVLEGDSPATARPLLASSDRALVELVRRELSGRLGERRSRKPRRCLRAREQGESKPT